MLMPVGFFFVWRWVTENLAQPDLYKKLTLVSAILALFGIFGDKAINLFVFMASATYYGLLRLNGESEGYFSLLKKVPLIFPILFKFRKAIISVVAVLLLLVTGSYIEQSWKESESARRQQEAYAAKAAENERAKAAEEEKKALLEKGQYYSEEQKASAINAERLLEEFLSDKGTSAQKKKLRDEISGKIFSDELSVYSVETIPLHTGRKIYKIRLVYPKKKNASFSNPYKLAVDTTIENEKMALSLQEGQLIKITGSIAEDKSQDFSFSLFDKVITLLDTQIDLATDQAPRADKTSDFLKDKGIKAMDKKSQPTAPQSVPAKGIHCTPYGCTENN